MSRVCRQLRLTRVIKVTRERGALATEWRERGEWRRLEQVYPALLSFCGRDSKSTRIAARARLDFCQADDRYL